MRKIFIICSFFFTSLLADETVSEFLGNTPDTQSYSYWGEFVNMLLTLGFILILIFVSVWVLKKIMRSRVQNLNRSNGIKILERRPLNSKSSLYLVDILGKGVVISESQSGIQVITEFSDTTKIDELYEHLQEEQEPRLSFRETFTKKLRKLTSKNA